MVINVKMADMQIAQAPNILKTLGLGSCVGVCIYDPILRIGGMVHIMLPFMGDYRDKSNVAKYADSGVWALIEQLQMRNAIKSRMIAKIAGGAQMFAVPNDSKVMKIGERNVTVVKSVLHDASIPIEGEDIGGNYGRTIEFCCKYGCLKIKSLGRGISYI